MSPTDPSRRNARVALICAGVFVAMVGAAFAAVPLYRTFCQATGFNGAVRRVSAAEKGPISDKTVVVRFDTNDYSVPTAYAHHELTAVGTVDTLRIVAGDRVVAEHKRCWDHEQVFYDPVHYLALLERKPGALDFAAPLSGWEVPAGPARTYR